MDLNTANGIWKFANNVSGATDLFLLEDSLITVRLTFISLNPNASPDGYYKLKAKWEGNTLNYLPPAADWVALAVFQDGRFVSVLENQPYTKCTINELNEYQKAILNQRIAWKYTE